MGLFISDVFIKLTVKWKKWNRHTHIFLWFRWILFVCVSGRTFLKEESVKKEEEVGEGGGRGRSSGWLHVQGPGGETRSGRPLFHVYKAFQLLVIHHAQHGKVPYFGGTVYQLTILSMAKHSTLGAQLQFTESQQIAFTFIYPEASITWKTHHCDHKKNPIISANCLCNIIGTLSCQWIMS